MTRRVFPDGYPPLTFCRECGRDFSGDTMFEAHRVGTHEYVYAEGLRMVPPREDGRRCLDADGMRARGWRPLTDEEMAVSRRDRHRYGFGVELWHDPVQVSATRERLRRPAGSPDASEGVSATSDPWEVSAA